MSILESLTRAYDRLPDAPPYGFSTEKIGFCVVLNPDGSVADVVDLRDTDKKRSPRMMPVPSRPKRSGQTPRPNFLWDNINYALGAGTLSDPEDQRFNVFRDKHLEFLGQSTDAELISFCEFLRNWSPEMLSQYFDLESLPSEGIVFAAADSYRNHYLHNSHAVQSIWLTGRDGWIAVEGKSAADAVCLVLGTRSSIARTHPPIKGVWGAQVAGAAIVTFNSDAYESYGHDQGDNAPVSEAAAFAYTTALNRFLEKDSGHRIQIGDASTVFWADSSDAKSAKDAEGLFARFVDPKEDDRDATKDIGIQLAKIRKGKPLRDVLPDLAEGVRFHVLGLAPNAARLSVRFMWESSFGKLTENYQRHWADMRIEPPPRDGYPPLWQYLTELAVLGKRENVPPNLAGDWMRAILAGAPYPLTLLSTTLMRLRGDGDVNALRVAILKSVLIRNFGRKVREMLDPEADNKGYVLGRLFAVYEEIQQATLGRNVKATIRDKFYGAASSAPRNVFGTLAALSMNHLTKLRKEKPGLASYFEDRVRGVVSILSPMDSPYPASLTAQDQAMFALGYYHQSSFKSSAAEPPSEKSETEE